MNRQQVFTALALVVTLAISAERLALAHEGHAALPSTGVALDGNQLLISPDAINAIAMRTSVIQLGDLHHNLELNARVELPWSGRATVTTLSDGKVESILVKPGEAVKEGQVLARVESLELATLQAQLLQTAAEMDMLQQRIKQREPLVAGGGIAGKLLRESQAELQQKQAEHEIVVQKLRGLGLDEATIEQTLETGETVTTLPVVAPIAGSIARIDARPGQLVEATEDLFEMVAMSKVSVVGKVLEGDAFQVQDGMTVTVTVDGPRPVRVVGRIDHVRMNLNETDRTLEAVVVVDNQDGLLRPGMFGRMSIAVASAEQEILCPTSALIESQRGIFVLKREGEGKYSLRPVKIGMRSPGKVVIKSGLFPGQQVISQGTQVLAAMFDDVSVGEQSSDEKPATPTPTAATATAATELNKDWILAAKAVVELPSNRKAVTTSLIEGRIVALHAAPGQIVQAGATLAELESQKLRDLQLELLQSAGRLRWNENEIQRLRPLAESRSTSALEFRQRELDLKTLTRQVTSLQRQLSLVGLEDESVERLRSGAAAEPGSNSPITGRIAIRSPIDGRVADFRMALGQLVHAHDSLFEIQDSRTVWIKALVLEKDASRIQTGDSAAATFPSHPSLRIQGKVVRLAPQLISRERVLPVWIEAVNPGGFLKEGMLARVEIGVDKQSETVAIHTIRSK